MRFSVNRHVIQPELSRVVSALHHIENTETIKHRAIGFVVGVESQDGGVAAQRGANSAPTASAIGIVGEGERIVGRTAGNGCLSTERRAPGSPQPSAILQIREEIRASA